jgi:DNA invertase Pin-like site-specific DNA recombinase
MPAARPCAHCGEVRVIHARGLCRPCYHLHRQDYSVVRNQRPWTAKEREYVRQHWGQKKCVVIALHLGRDRRAVFAAAVRFGVAQDRRRIRKVNERLKQRIYRLHDQGLSDREIGQKIGRSHTTVARWLRAVGRPSNCRTAPTGPFPEATKEKIRRHQFNRIAREGLEEAVPFLRRHIEARAEARRLGWPQAETLREARILDSLFEHGPSTLGQVASDLGTTRHWTGIVLRSLKRRGLIVVRWRTSGAEYYAGDRCVYGLAWGPQRAPASRQQGDGPRCSASRRSRSPHLSHLTLRRITMLESRPGPWPAWVTQLQMQLRHCRNVEALLVLDRSPRLPTERSPQSIRAERAQAGQLTEPVIAPAPPPDPRLTEVRKEIARLIAREGPLPPWALSSRLALMPRQIDEALDCCDWFDVEAGRVYLSNEVRRHLED